MDDGTAAEISNFNFEISDKGEEGFVRVTRLGLQYWSGDFKFQTAWLTSRPSRTSIERRERGVDLLREEVPGGQFGGDYVERAQQAAPLRF